MALILKFRTDVDRDQFMEKLQRNRPDLLPASRLSKTTPVVVFTGLSGEQQDWLKQHDGRTTTVFEDIDFGPTPPIG